MTMDNRIYKIFTGEYIDLERIVTISEPRMYDGTNEGAYGYFQIAFQLMEKPLFYKKWFTHFYIHAQCENNDTWSAVEKKFEGRVKRHDSTALRIETQKLNKQEFEEFKVMYDKFVSDYKEYHKDK